MECELITCADLIGLISSESANYNKLINAIIAAFVGALSAYAFNKIHWHQVHQIEQSKSIINDVDKLASSIEELAVKYWLQDYNASSAGDLKLMEISIKSYLRIIINFCKLFRENKIPSDLESLTNELFELCTGGDFESIRRIKCENTATNIAIICAEIRLDLSKSLYSTRT